MASGKQSGTVGVSKRTGHDITLAELDSLIRQSVNVPTDDNDDGWRSLAGWCKLWDIPETTAKRKLLQALDAGIMERDKRQREIRAGIRYVWCYRKV